MKKLVVLLSLLAFVATSCGAGSDDSSAELEKSKARVAELEAAASTTVTTAEGPATTGAPTTAAPTTAAPTTVAPTTAAPVTEAAAPAALMPNVVCMNLQDAQDFIQSETGVFYSRSEDASGAGRSQLMDSNWVVVAQRPAVRTPIGEGDAVLSAVKLDEPNNC